MTEIDLVVNGRKVRGSIEPRMHLGDFLRENLHLTGTHLRCEQGVCGACTLLVDGLPARSCITYAVACQEAEVTTIEGLEPEPLMARLRDAFAREHALQCGFCTPGMLITARDIVTRLPDADEKRVRLELSGNLCRCTGYSGIVRAILHVLSEKTNTWALIAPPLGQLGPAGARPLAKTGKKVATIASEDHARAVPFDATADLGLGARSPNLETRVTCAINRPADEVWALLNDIGLVARCIPGASLTALPSGGFAQGRVKMRIGPISANFEGAARILRDEERRQGLVYGAAGDRFSRSSARADAAYTVREAGTASTHVELSIRALLSGPLGQFGRAQIVQDFIARLAGEFARRLEYVLEHGGEADPVPDTALRPLVFFRAILAIRLRSLVARLFRRRLGLSRGDT